MHIEVHAEITYLGRIVDKGFFCPKRLSEIREVFIFWKKCKYLPICCLLVLFQKPPERLLAFRFPPLKLCWQWKSTLLRIWTFSAGEDGMSVPSGPHHACEILMQRAPGRLITTVHTWATTTQVRSQLGLNSQDKACVRDAVLSYSKNSGPFVTSHLIKTAACISANSQLLKGWLR